MNTRRTIDSDHPARDLAASALLVAILLVPILVAALANLP